MSRANYLDMIQRDLDGDLSPVEQADLERKLATDPELQLIHSRLSQVSARLEQLPQVTPPFSIVDSILPQLDSSSPDPVQTKAQPHLRELPRLEKKIEREPEEKPRKIPSWMLKASSGVVAASLLFGLYAITHPAKPELDPDQTNGSASVPTETISTKTNPTPGEEQVVENKTPTNKDPGQITDPSATKQQSTVNQTKDPSSTTKENEGKDGSNLNPSPYLSPSKRATATQSEKDKTKNDERDKEKNKDKDSEKDKEKNESILNKEKKKTAASSKASPARDEESQTTRTTESEKNEKDKVKGYEKDKNKKQKSNDN